MIPSRPPVPSVHTPSPPHTPLSPNTNIPPSPLLTTSLATRATRRPSIHEEPAPLPASALDHLRYPLAGRTPLPPNDPRSAVFRYDPAAQPHLEQSLRAALYDTILDALMPSLRSLHTLLRAQCGDYVASTIEDILYSIPRVIIPPCVHLLHSYNYHTSHITQGASTIHPSLVPFVLRVATPLYYLSRVVFPCGVLAPAFLYIVEHRRHRAFPAIIHGYHQLVYTLLNTLGRLYDRYFALTTPTSFFTALTFYQHVIDLECSQLHQYYRHLNQQRTRITPDPFYDSRNPLTPAFTDHQSSQVYIPRLDSRFPSIDALTLFQLVSTPYVSPDLLYFVPYEYSLHVPRDHLVLLPVTPPTNRPSSRPPPDSQAPAPPPSQLASSCTIQATPPSPLQLPSDSEATMATPDAGSLPEDLPNPSTPQLGPLSSPPSETPRSSASSSSSITALAPPGSPSPPASRPPPGFSASTLTDTIRQTARDIIAHQLRAVTEQHSKQSSDFQEQLRATTERTTKATNELTQQAQATLQQLQSIQQQLTHLCGALAQQSKRASTTTPTYPEIDPPSRRPFAALAPAVPSASSWPFPSPEPPPSASSSSRDRQTTDLTPHFSLPASPPLPDTSVPQPPLSSSLPTFTEPVGTSSSQPFNDQLLDALREGRQPRPLNLDTFLNNPRPPKLTEDDMERFARKPLQELTEAETRAFADQLEQYLTLDTTNPELRDEARALRSLSQYMRWTTIAKWLKLYANPSSQFQFPKTTFWRHKYDNYAHECIPHSHRPPDLTDSIHRLTQTVATFFAPPAPNPSRPHNPFRPRNANHQFPQTQQPYSQPSNQSSSSQSTPSATQQPSFRPPSTSPTSNWRPRPFNHNSSRPFNSSQHQYSPPAHAQHTQTQYSQTQPQSQFRTFQNNRPMQNNYNNPQRSSTPQTTNCCLAQPEYDASLSPDSLHQDIQNILHPSHADDQSSSLDHFDNEQAHFQ